MGVDIIEPAKGTQSHSTNDHVQHLAVLLIQLRTSMGLLMEPAWNFEIVYTSSGHVPSSLTASGALMSMHRSLTNELGHSNSQM